MPTNTNTFTVTRTQDEILSRFNAAEDWLGWTKEVLLAYLDFDHAQPLLKSGVTAEQWNERDDADLDVDIRRYLDFAVGNIQNQRGISAERSVIKLIEMAWLAGRDDVVAAMHEAEYPDYGEPKIRAFASGMGLDWPDE